MNKAQHPTSGIAKRCTSHQIPHHAVWFGGIEIREKWCDVRCGMVCGAENVVWCEICWWRVVCITLHCPLYPAPHYIRVPPHSTSNTDHLSHLFQTTPHSTPHHHSSPYRTFHITPAPLATLYSTLQYHKIISNRSATDICHMHRATSRIASHFTLRSISDHTIYWPRYATLYNCKISALWCDTTRHWFYSCTASVLHNCIIPPHLTVITPNSTSHYHVSHNSPYRTSVHHILHPTTCHISHNTTSTTTYRAVSRPTLCLIPYRTTFHISPMSQPTLYLIKFHMRHNVHIPCHSTHTPPLSITPFQFERFELCIWAFSVLKTRPKRVPLPR